MAMAIILFQCSSDLRFVANFYRYRFNEWTNNRDFPKKILVGTFHNGRNFLLFKNVVIAYKNFFHTNLNANKVAIGIININTIDICYSSILKRFMHGFEKSSESNDSSINLFCMKQMSKLFADHLV